MELSGVEHEVLRDCEKLFGELVEHQRARVLKHARALRPDLSPDDLLQPHDYPEVESDPGFQFEDGMLSGILAAQTAFRARIANPRREKRKG